MYPEIHLTSEISLPTYLVTVSLTYCLGLLWLVKRTTDQDMDRATALDVAFAVMVGGFLGSRLFHVFYELPDYYSAHPIEVFKFWNGGFVFYGGAFLAFAFGFVLIKWKGQPAGPWADLFAPVGAFCYALGRIGCLLNGCCYGKHCDLPWNINGRHPAPAYATLLEFGILGILLFCERMQSRSPKKWLWIHPSGRLFVLWMGLHGISRLFLESVRADDRGPTLIFDLSVSSWISLGFVGFSAGVFVRDFILNMRSSKVSM